MEIIEMENISDDRLKEEIPKGAKVELIKGEYFDFSTLKIDEKVPNTRMFHVLNYKNPKTQRAVKILKCDYPDCNMYFRKWHNFFDHLRVHTGERPFVCHYSDCNQAFTQKANLNKHLEIHKRKKRFNCKRCQKIFIS